MKWRVFWGGVKSGYFYKLYLTKFSSFMTTITFGLWKTTILCQPCGRRFTNLEDFMIHLRAVGFHK